MWKILEYLNPLRSEAGFWQFAIPAAISLIGGALKNKGDKKQQTQQHEQGRGEYERADAARRARAQVLQDILQRRGRGGVVDPALLDRLKAPTPYPEAAGSNWMQGIGGAAQSIAPFIYAGMNEGAAPPPSASPVTMPTTPVGSSYQSGASAQLSGFGNAGGQGGWWDDYYNMLTGNGAPPR